jgi:hypothetical protein
MAMQSAATAVFQQQVSNVYLRTTMELLVMNNDVGLSIHRYYIINVNNKLWTGIVLMAMPGPAFCFDVHPDPDPQYSTCRLNTVMFFSFFSS